MSFLQELQRRKMFRLEALYIVGVWVVLQVQDLVMMVKVKVDEWVFIEDMAHNEQLGGYDADYYS